MKTPKTNEPVTQSGADEVREDDTSKKQPSTPKKEIGGRGGLDPVRYGDWEKGGKCVDF